ncbi:MAG TPA: phosphoribosylanthranilate isomerase [Rhodomicrobium sp.]|nr:phosphoribosylanthranilate isomerase [Rhodomicrobium sp.]
MTILVKICGISTEEALEAAIDAGSDYAGFVFFERSPRNVTLSRAAALARRAEGRIKTVALTVNAGADAIEEIAGEVHPDFFQLHGSENVERIAAVRKLTSARIIKAIKVGTPCDIQGARLYEDESDLLLFDAQAVSLPNALPGGNGLSFNWCWLSGAALRPDFMLSGGLRAENVITALRESGAAAVDVSSGVETSPGVKDPALIRAFIKTAKSFERAASPVSAE